MKWATICVLTGLGWLACIAAGHAADDTASLAELQGTWQAVALTAGGQHAPEAVVQSFQLLIKDAVVTFKKNENRFPQQSKFEVDASTLPKSINFTALNGPRKGQTTLGIYRLENDELTICMCQFREDPRPTEFKTVAGDRLGVMIFRKVKGEGEKSPTP